MGYQPDIKLSGDEKLLVNFNRHSDNYSSCDLSEEARLMTARIGYLLEHIDSTDEISTDMSWEKIQKAILVKSKLVEIQARLTMAVTAFAESQRLNEERIRDLRHKQKLSEHKINSVPVEEFRESISKVTEIMFKYVPMEKMGECISDFEAVVTEIATSVNEFKPENQ